MLVITRKADEALDINGGEITVTVLAVEGDRVKLGIRAPRHISIMRQELCQVVGEENRAAAMPLPDSSQAVAAVRALIIKS
jgi:carbon storage regulator